MTNVLGLLELVATSPLPGVLLKEIDQQEGDREDHLIVEDAIIRMVARMAPVFSGHERHGEMDTGTAYWCSCCLTFLEYSAWERNLSPWQLRRLVMELYALLMSIDDGPEIIWALWPDWAWQMVRARFEDAYMTRLRATRSGSEDRVTALTGLFLATLRHPDTTLPRWHEAMTYRVGRLAASVWPRVESLVAQLPEALRRRIEVAASAGG